MTKDQIKAYIKNNMELYLKIKGIDTSRHFSCLNKAHKDIHPSMSLDKKRNKVHCFICKADYDTFDLIGIDYNLNHYKDIFIKACEIFNIKDDEASLEVDSYKSGRLNSKKYDFKDYIARCHQNTNSSHYLEDRGISKETAEHFMLGYDFEYHNKVEGETWEALIIPVDEESITVRNINSDNKINRYWKIGTNRIFNSQVFSDSKSPIFVVEGELDAISVTESGGVSAALRSTANVAVFLKILEELKPSTPLILSLDGDEEGKRTIDSLVMEPEKLSIPFYIVYINCGYKDPNEALIYNREAFIIAVREAENISMTVKEIEDTNYLKTSAAYHLSSFLGEIKENIDTSYISTSFSSLDLVLGGGLFEGLYILGAVSSLGKTTLTTQIADQIALQKKTF